MTTLRILYVLDVLEVITIIISCNALITAIIVDLAEKYNNWRTHSSRRVPPAL